MEENSSCSNPIQLTDAPQLVDLLKEMKQGLDVVMSKAQALTEKVKQNQFPTADGISYLEVKHLLLLCYCQNIVYYLLRKAQGFPVKDHPVIRSFVEIRLFLEKIRPIDKKLQYQIQKLIKAAGRTLDNAIPKNEKDTSQDAEDPLKYRPNPDLLLKKSFPEAEDGNGLYRPPKFAPTAMDEDKISKKEKLAMRKDKEMLRQAKQNVYLREIIDSIEERPEEVSEVIGAESRELQRYKAKMEERAQQEEELFTRVPLGKLDKKRAKHLKKSRSGLLGLMESFEDELRSLPIEAHDDQNIRGSTNRSSKKNKKFKRC